MGRRPPALYFLASPLCGCATRTTISPRKLPSGGVRETRVSTRNDASDGDETFAICAERTRSRGDEDVRPNRTAHPLQ